MTEPGRIATVLGLDEAEQPKEADIAVARSGATSRHAQWREELLKAGIRGKGGQHLKLMDLETLPGAKYLHAVGTVAETGERVAFSSGEWVLRFCFDISGPFEIGLGIA